MDAWTMPGWRARWLAASLLGLTLGGACKDQDAKRIAYMQMRPAGEGFLLVGHVPDELTGYRRLGRVALMNEEGVIEHHLDERTVFAVAGVSEGIVWITRKTASGEPSAHRVSDLAPVAGAKVAVAEHPVLSTTNRVLGVHGDDLVLEGANSRRYAVSPKGEIRTVDADLRIVPPAATEGGKRDLVPVRGRPLPKAPKARKAAIEARFDNAYMLAQSPEVLGRDSDDILITSTEFTKGGPRPVLSRVGPKGEVRWSAPLAELAAPVKVDDAQVELVSIVVRGSATWMLLRAAALERYRGDDYYEVEHRLIRLDPDEGEAAESHRLRESG